LGRLLAILIILVFVASLKGSEKYPSFIGIDYCGTGYWGINILMFLICMVFIKIMMFELTEKDKLRVKLGYKFSPGLYRISKDTINRLSFFSFLSGISAGTLGTGGGLILVPMLLSLNIKPTVVSTTSGFTILFIMMMTLSQHVLFGSISLEHLIFFGIVSLIGCYFVSQLIINLCRKWKRESLILFVIVCVVSVSFVIVPYNAAKRIIKKGVELNFSKFC